MHLPDDVIEEVCTLISSKTTGPITLFEAYPRKPGAKVKRGYKNYIFERDYESMFRGVLVCSPSVKQQG